MVNNHMCACLWTWLNDVRLGDDDDDLLFVGLHALVQLDDVAADEPHQVAEVRHRRLVPDVVQHVLVVHCRGEGQDGVVIRADNRSEGHMTPTHLLTNYQRVAIKDDRIMNNRSIKIGGGGGERGINQPN